MRLEGKTAIITGANSGIGLETAKLFLGEGAKVLGADVNLDMMEALAAENSGRFIFCKCDVRNKEDILNMYDMAMKEFNRVDIVINNAGILDGIRPIDEMPDDIWDMIYEINQRSVFWSCRRAVEIMKPQGGGSIINMGSAASIRGLQGGIAYTATKHAVLGMTRNIASFYGEDNIRCNCICPANIKTNVARAAKPIMSKTGINVVGTRGHASRSAGPEEVSNACLYLASDESRFVNGVELVLDYGLTIH